MKIHFLENSLFGKFTCKFTFFFLEIDICVSLRRRKNLTFEIPGGVRTLTSLYSDALKANN